MTLHDTDASHWFCDMDNVTRARALILTVDDHSINDCLDQRDVGDGLVSATKHDTENTGLSALSSWRWVHGWGKEVWRTLVTVYILQQRTEDVRRCTPRRGCGGEEQRLSRNG